MVISSPSTPRFPTYRTSSVSSQPWVTYPGQPVTARESPSPRLYQYLGPTQALALFLAGMGTSLTLRWMMTGLKSADRLHQKLTADKASAPFEKLSRIPNAKMEESAASYFMGGEWLSALMFALKFPEIRDSLLAYIGAGASGYILGTMVGGTKEVLVRKEETQIRANLQERLKATFQKSIHLKTTSDSGLREQAKLRILQLLQQYRVPNPEALLSPIPIASPNRQYRYPGEPVHFTQPFASQRFGQTPFPVEFTDIPSAPWHLTLAKGVLFGMGLACGALGQLMYGFLKNADRVTRHTPEVTRSIQVVYNTIGVETLFLLGNSRHIKVVLGLVMATKLGKLLVDAYREIEVTRRNADTELRYQRYNWLSLDPAYHRIAEEEGLKQALRQLEQLIPRAMQNRPLLQAQIQTVLDNVSRRSMPYYMPMTPMINLTEARG